MPIYEYRCDNGHTFEVMQRISDDALETCQVCDAPVHKVLHAPAVHFKGSGFYSTDYGKKKAGANGGDKKDKAESNGSSGASESSSSGSESGGSKESKKSEPAKAASKPD